MDTKYVFDSFNTGVIKSAVADSINGVRSDSFSYQRYVLPSGAPAVDNVNAPSRHTEPPVTDAGDATASTFSGMCFSLAEPHLMGVARIRRSFVPFCSFSAAIVHSNAPEPSC